MFVFITGASSGLGQALAKRYAAQGATLGLVARRIDKLEQLLATLGEPATSGHHCYGLDVRDRVALHEAARDFIQKAEALGQQVDVVIANAGISAGTLTDKPEDFAVFEEIFDTNVLALVATFEPFTSAMIRTGKGCLVGMSSVAGVRGLPGAGAYSASKAAVSAYCESLRLELRPKGVQVVTIAPGYVKSEMTAKNAYRMPFLMEADAFAAQAVQAIEQRKSLTVIPWQMGWVASVLRVLPNWLYDRLLMNAPRKARKSS